VKSGELKASLIGGRWIVMDTPEDRTDPTDDPLETT
jgi:hypothetical protein